MATTIASFNTQVNNLLQPFDLPVLRSALQLFLVLYGGKARPELPAFIRQYMKSYWFQLLILFLILFTAIKDFGTAILIAIAYGLSMRQMNDEDILSGAQNFVQDNIIRPVQGMFTHQQSGVSGMPPEGHYAPAPQAIFEDAQVIPLKQIQQTPQWFIDVAKNAPNPLEPAQLHITDLQTGISTEGDNTMPSGLVPKNVEFLASV